MISTYPKITVIMPVINRRDTIEKAIRSLIDQKYPFLEFLVMDGGSIDGTLDIIKQYESHISYWRSRPDENAGAAINEGILRSSGELVALLMADDQYKNNILWHIAETFITYSDADMVTCGGEVVQFDADSNVLKKILKFHTEESLRLDVYHICFGSSAVCCRFIKRSSYLRLGLYDCLDGRKEYVYSNDKAFLIKAFLHGVKNIFVPVMGYQYLSHPDSSTFGRNKKNIMRMCAEHMTHAKFFLSANNVNTFNKLLLVYWYNDQSARLLIYSLMNRKMASAYWPVIASALKHPFIWIVSFGITTVRILKKHMLTWRI